jgi:hypothetical protein
MIDVNVYQEYLFHAKMLIEAFDLDNSLFSPEPRRLFRWEPA